MASAVSDRFRVSLVQMQVAPRPEDNVAAAIRALAASSRRGADLCILPELFTNRYVGQFPDARARSLEVVRLPMPAARSLYGVPITPSYANHCLANGGVVAPTYGLREDRVALDILGTVHPGREIVGVDARYLERGGGAVHCITQQRPAGRPLPP